MTAGMRSALVPPLVIALGTTVLPLAGCKIVPNDQRASTTESSGAAAQASFDAAAYVDGVWDKKLLPHFETKAVDALKVIEAIKPIVAKYEEPSRAAVAKVGGKVADNPFLSVVVAFGAGIVIGKLLDLCCRGCGEEEE